MICYQENGTTIYCSKETHHPGIGETFTVDAKTYRVDSVVWEPGKVDTVTPPVLRFSSAVVAVTDITA